MADISLQQNESSWENQENGQKITRYYHEKRAVFRNKLGHLVVFVVYGQGRNTN